LDSGLEIGANQKDIMTQEIQQTTPIRSRALPRLTQLLLVLALAAVVGTALGLGWGGAHVFGRTADAGVEESGKRPVRPGTFQPTPQQLTNLKVAEVTSMTFRTEEMADGRIAIDNDRTTPVFSPFTGRVTKIFANQGDHVKQGAPLLALEASEFVQGQNDLMSASASLNIARSQLVQSQINEKRKHALYDAKGGSLQDWQQSQADLVTAQNNVRSAETALASARNRLHILGKSDKEIEALANAQKMDPVAYVLAPIDGTVIDRQVGLGQYIQSNAANPIYSIGDLSKVWLTANAHETDAPLIRVGAPVEVRLLAFPGRVFKAEITYVAPSVDPNTHRLPVRAEVENPDGALKPEMFASFSIITGEATAVGVPEEAVVYEDDTARVWVAEEDGTIALREIHTGRTSNGMVEVVGGLAAGEKVVTSGALFIDRAASGE